MKRSLVHLAAITALVACADGTLPTEPGVAAAPRFAKSTAAMPTTTNERIPISGVVLSPCTGETVAYRGTMHVVTTTKTDASGTHTAVHSNWADVKGTAVGSGRRYVLESNHKETTDVQTNGSGSFESSEYFRVISQGSLDNWFVRIRLRGTIDANGNRIVADNQSEEECRG
jgi:hypothetical protein